MMVFLTFFINNEEIHKTRYKVLGEEYSELTDAYFIEIDPRKEDSKELDLNNVVRFSLFGGDTLTCDDFPGESYDDSFSGTSYFVRD